MTNALLFYLCVWLTVLGVLNLREQPSAFRNRQETQAKLDDLVEEGLIRLELKEAGRHPVVARVRHQQQKRSEARGGDTVEQSLDLAHDLILRTQSDSGVRA